MLLSPIAEVRMRRGGTWEGRVQTIDCLDAFLPYVACQLLGDGAPGEHRLKEKLVDISGMDHERDGEVYYIS